MTRDHDDDRWLRFSDPGTCEYCDDANVAVMNEPFGMKPACRECWELICYGD